MSLEAGSSCDFIQLLFRVTLMKGDECACGKVLCVFGPMTSHVEKPSSSYRTVVSYSRVGASKTRVSVWLGSFQS